MKIRKKVQGAEEVISEVAQPAKSCPYDEATQHIMGAIDALSKLPDDILARDSIANLSVVLLDLKC